MSTQLGLNLPPRVSSARSDFFVSDANRLVLAELDRWQEWPQGKLIVTGPKAAGKSHLVQIWAAASAARVIEAVSLHKCAPLIEAHGPDMAFAIEDVPHIAGDKAGEEALLHLHNLTLAEGGRLLMTGLGEPSRWGIVLPDLASRISGSPTAHLAPPDDALISALLVKHFGDRGLAAPPSLVAWLALRIDRSYVAVLDVVARLDAAALETGRSLGPKLAAEILGEGIPAAARTK